MKFKLSSIFMAAAAAAAMTAGGAQAATIVKNVAPVSVIPGLTGFATTGAMMTNLSVTANFSGGLTQTLLWATTGAASGGVTGTGWGLSLDGDSFATNWQFSITGTNLGTLTSLVLDGSSALTVLDTTNPSFGTPDSAQGADFQITSDATLNSIATATYDLPVAISPNGAVGDLFQKVTVTFDGDGPRSSFTFRQDTDNDSRLNQVPEPSGIALAGIALLALSATARRARKG